MDSEKQSRRLNFINLRPNKKKIRYRIRKRVCRSRFRPKIEDSGSLMPANGHRKKHRWRKLRKMLIILRARYKLTEKMPRLRLKNTRRSWKQQLRAFSRCSSCTVDSSSKLRHTKKLCKSYITPHLRLQDYKGRFSRQAERNPKRAKLTSSSDTNSIHHQHIIIKIVDKR